MIEHFTKKKAYQSNILLMNKIICQQKFENSSSPEKEKKLIDLSWCDFLIFTVFLFISCTSEVYKTSQKRL